MRAEGAGECLEHLRAIRLQADELTADLAEVKARLDALILGFGELDHRAGRIGTRLDRLDSRLERIERRLRARTV